jgi:polyisoprenoid-binding protein YceI
MSTTTSTGSSTNTGRLPGYVAGTWTIDPVHSEVGFTVRHMMVSKVRGTFRSFGGTIVTGEDPLESSVSAEVDLATIDTRNEQRDAHIRSADFFDVEQFPTMTFRSTEVRPRGEDFVLVGDLSLHGVTRPVELDLELHGFTGDPYGGTRVGFSATGQINRRDFGVDIAMPMDGGGVVVGDKVQIELEIQAVLDQQ